MTQQHPTAVETLADLRAWLTDNEAGYEDDPDATSAALADLFARAERGGGDLHDPTPELLTWLVHDLVRSDVEQGEYEEAVEALPTYLLYLRARGLWRRSDRNRQLCWTVLSWAAERPLGLPSLGAFVDDLIAGLLTQQPAPAELLDTGVRSRFVPPLRATLDRLGAQRRITREEVAAILQEPADSVATQLWLRALHAADLANAGEDFDVLEPSSEVERAGGCPPPSVDLIDALVRGLVRSAIDLGLSADIADDPDTFPRGMTTVIALVCGCDLSVYDADDEDEDDEEEGTVAFVEMFAGNLSPEGTPTEQIVADVMSVLGVLVRFGVLEQQTLPQGNEALGVPAALRYRVIRSIADQVGVGASEELEWAPVDLPAPEPARMLDLRIDVEGADMWRTFRMPTTETLAFLNGVIQSSARWRGFRSHVFLDADGVRRFTDGYWLGWFDGEDDAAITESEAVTLGAVLTQVGDQLTYLYGDSDDPWRVRVRVEQVTAGPLEEADLVDGEGRVPSEPTVIGMSVYGRLPDGLRVPMDLERAWAFMEEEVWGWGYPGRNALTPGEPGETGSVVFYEASTLDGFLPEGSPALERLMPLGPIDGTGSIAALWWPDGEVTPVVVGLGSEGEAFVLARSVRDYLALIAIGYDELSPVTLGAPPDDPEIVEATAEMREWLREELDIEVPPFWPEVGEDEFTAWVEKHRGDAGRAVG